MRPSVEKQVSTSQTKEEYRSSSARASVLKQNSAQSGSSHLAAQAARAYGCASQKSTEELVTDYIPLVHRIVSQVASYLRPPLTRDDLVSAGCLGLVKAAKNFDPFKDADFKTYAYIRVRGSVIDELRSWSFTPTGTNKKLKELERVYQQLEDELGVLPSDEQIAECMSISIEDLYKLYESSRGHNFLSLHKQSEDGFGFNDTLPDESVDSPGSKLDKHELATKLKEEILKLPEKHKQIIVLYYQQELTMKEVAQVLEITESRVSQIHASAIYKLQSKLRIFDDTEQ